MARVVQHVVAPIARTYEPQLVLVSAGFDAHRDDPLASCMLTDETYAAMAALDARRGRELDAPLLFLLEGGYDLGALARSVAATIDAARGSEPPEAAPLVEPARSAASHYARFWPTLSAA